MIAELCSQLCGSTAAANRVEIYSQVLHSSMSIILSVEVRLNHMGSPEEVLRWTLLPEIFGLVRRACRLEFFVCLFFVNSTDCNVLGWEPFVY